MYKLPYKWHVAGAVYYTADAAHLPIKHDRGECRTLHAPFGLWLDLNAQCKLYIDVRLAAVTDLYRNAAAYGIDWRDIPLPAEVQQRAAARPLRWHAYGAESNIDPARAALCAGLIDWAAADGGPDAEIMYPDDLPTDPDTGYTDDDAIASWDAEHDDDLQAVFLIACIRAGIHPLQLQPAINASDLGYYPYGYSPRTVKY